MTKVEANGHDPQGSDLAGRLDRVESLLAIRELKARYAEAVDRRYHRGSVVEAPALAAAARQAASLFTEDAVWDGGPALGRVVGRDAIAERLAEPTLAFARHLFLSPQVELDDHDPDRARGRWQLLSPCRRDDGEELWLCGSEDDEYQRVDGRWLHRSMRMTTVLLAPPGGDWRILG